MILDWVVWFILIVIGSAQSQSRFEPPPAAELGSADRPSVSLAEEWTPRPCPVRPSSLPRDEPGRLAGRLTPQPPVAIRLFALPAGIAFAGP